MFMLVIFYFVGCAVKIKTRRCEGFAMDRKSQI